MKEFSLLLGGMAGDGIDKASLILARILNRLGYCIYIYREYPSIIRGGHTYSIIRASQNKITTHTNKVDCILALNQDCLSLHKDRLKNDSFIIYDSDAVKPEGLPLIKQLQGIPLDKIIKEEKALAVTRNSCIIGSFCKASGIKMEILEDVFKRNISRELDMNLKVALKGNENTKELFKLEKISERCFPIFTGNEAISFGLIKGGLNSYIAYPMTPTSNILHFLASLAEKFSLKVIHPENEISVMLMAEGFAYAGERVAVGTAGGGFCLMTEGLTFAGMAELPVVIILGQRTGPSTGLPTYTGQTELHFALNAGQGEFTRLVIAPGDAEEAYFWSALCLNLVWKYQLPGIILVDKTLCEGTYSFNIDAIENIKKCEPVLWDRKEQYKRYLNTETGISPLAFPSDKDAIIKINSYEHDEAGITIEDSVTTKDMCDKRLRKEKYLLEELIEYKPVRVYENANSTVGIICWGSNKGVCIEAGQNLGFKIIQPVVLSPFPKEEFKSAISGLKKIICVENNATGQLIKLIKYYGFDVDEKILKYDGRPFSLDELENELRKIL
ncbi:2-oxoacid:acceptor oxidoreductase subunit alpha [Candidatus Desantisbacteria bacterium]|nr:2-oxoacid:acceptor oxidoreductase subunit alpha [Candidatus Desantisbacteria bacterium]